ncbi:hypothetical protein HNQ80_004599 [Anaerosolibacter carboniphilus]|uniref:Uncharacterized protein n=1 Tax=Anaerosolibacter carboniphilus TaxID=1417629 RepID=A0A841L841_9FIRM|nr:hypothetical protein [Anaerosolibacter carboniphilus]
MVNFSTINVSYRAYVKNGLSANFKANELLVSLDDGRVIDGNEKVIIRNGKAFVDLVSVANIANYELIRSEDYYSA